MAGGCTGLWPCLRASVTAAAVLAVLVKFNEAELMHQSNTLIKLLSEIIECRYMCMMNTPVPPQMAAGVKFEGNAGRVRLAALRLLLPPATEHSRPGSPTAVRLHPAQRLPLQAPP